MGLIPENKVAEIRDRTDIVAVIGEHVALRRAGTNHLGLCPFHNERSPSFNVSQAKQFFYCFGCQKSGDVFRFLMELQGRTFAEVARELARRAGIDIPEGNEAETAEQRRRRVAMEDERARLLRLHDLSAAFFEAQLQRHPHALRYVEERGIGKEVQQRFRLGFAPEGWDHLVQHLAQKGVPHELCERAGLCVRRENSGALPKGAPPNKVSHYDRFRDRVIFPLLNIHGDVIAFGGRVLPGEAATAKEVAKYINSPESPLYKKGENLYGLHAAKESIRKRRQVILVEGNFDVLSLHQSGFDQTVAPMGTALTETQLRLLKRLLGEEGHVVLMLDGDRAGRSATMKDIWLFSQADISDMALFTGSGVDVRVARLPDGEDPDTYVLRKPTGFEKCLKGAQPAVDYVLDEAIKLAENDSIAERAKVLLKVAPLLLAIRSAPTQEMYIDKLANSLNIAPELVWRTVRSHVAARPAAPSTRSAPPPAAPAVREGAPASAQSSRAPAPPAQNRGAGPQGSYSAQAPGRPAPRPESQSAPQHQGAQPTGSRPVPASQGSAPPPPPRAPQAAAPREEAPTAYRSYEADLISLCGDHPRLLRELGDDLIDQLDDPVLAELLREARELALQGEPPNARQLIELAPIEIRGLVASAALAGTFSKSENPAVALAEIGNRVRARFVQRELEDLNRALARACKAGDQRSIQELSLRMQELRLMKAGQTGQRA